jgi:excinuclease ABC subunit A
MQKPNVEYIDGLSPAISIDQKTTSHNPRSTVGTVTEIYDYLRLLFASIGIPHCPSCGKEIKAISVDQISEMIMNSLEGSRVIIMAPIVNGRKGEHKKIFETLKSEGFTRVKVDGEMRTLDEEIILEKNIKHHISAVIDRLIVKPDMQRRLTDSVETALRVAEGLIIVEIDGKETLYSTKFTCPDCDVSIPELSPRMFSFNSPFGACPKCAGLGVCMEVDPQKIIPDENLTLKDRAIKIGGYALMEYPYIVKKTTRALSEKYGFSLNVPWKDLDKKVKDMLLYGKGVKGSSLEEYKSNLFKSDHSGFFIGFVNMLKDRYDNSRSEYVKLDIEKYMAPIPCNECNGKRLRREVMFVTVGNRNIVELTDMPITMLYNWFQQLKLSENDTKISERIINEIKARINFLINVGLGYLTLSRMSSTLSGGESQRIRLATQIGSGLTGVIYILDEPSIGLHQRDNKKLLNSLLKLRDSGNTLIVVEHDEETIRTADQIIDIGPYAGEKGGYLVAQGTVQDIMSEPTSITGDYLAGRRYINTPENYRKTSDKYITVVGARENNLKNINVDIPIGLFTTITGVSGSGKSSLIIDVLYPYVARKINGSDIKLGDCDRVDGLEYIDKVIVIDQSPIGRTPRSNPATYTGVFTNIRNLFAMTPDAKARGYKAGRFSFNIKGGRCENCKGDGSLLVEMHFLPDIYVKCEVCDGKRYNKETLAVKYKGKSIFDVLDMTVDRACEFFENIPMIYNKIKALQDVGLGYIKLGQPSTTLSGGEAQRVKLATELSKRHTGKTLYILDEPTTGLHAADVEKLLIILQRLVDSGNTVIVIEHNLDVIKTSDFVIDLGPEGGDAGGYVIASGTPKDIMENENSFTGESLREFLQGENR